MIREKPILIGISGPSCSGKTTLAEHLIGMLPGKNNSIISVDSYYRDLTKVNEKERSIWNFDLPQALDSILLEKHTHNLAEGRSILKPVYLFPSHTRAPEGVLIESGSFVILEGLFALYWKSIRNLMTVKIFLDAPDQTCRKRRFERDIRERGCTLDELISQYEEQVLPCYEKYILPTQQYAHLILDGSQPASLLSSSVMNLIERLRKE